MANKIKRTISIAPESDYEIHRLAKLWKVPVTQARERCYHYAATWAHTGAVLVGTAEVRQAEAKVEMLKEAKS
jgi:hypothetical protein